jgi:hypothetical protein
MKAHAECDYGHCLKQATHEHDKATARGFEALRAEPNGFRAHLLNRSDTLSSVCVKKKTVTGTQTQAVWIEATDR